MTILNYQTILVAVDGSTEANYALDKAIYLAKEDDAQLIICFVLDNRSTGTIAISDHSYVEHAKQYGNSLLNECQEKAVQAGLTNVKSVLEFGTPKITIATEIAPKHNVELIVAGATGLNAVERLIVGSVSENIVRRAKCDVLIVRKRD
ncbi:universal stress protein [Halalkalibacter alkalisediminis]|uniref:Universal stress protein n=1 Tax=Halalkalibacter alkalisediminis TaxID=935616 RepID=A0ABV6NJI4_9BACI|nr:universal stress protein [Halalkalibacter alkalisediminis]